MRDSKSPPRGNCLRQGRTSEHGRLYLITTVTRSRKPLFANFALARTTIATLYTDKRVATMAYVLMPDHLHWIFELKRGTLSTVVGAMKSVSARQHGGPMWQPGFHDHALRREEDIQKVARYLIANPLRAGLVDCIGDYPHWDAVWL
ncbi:transposase [Halopseudomonas nanhaiensis]|uniref:REP-associated tyrosine transposase n=1 Tax=Halopseudomonas nanhaiensis TaxID=2830842 RepID=UPI001CBDD561|nr:transposase [Halopseudomonas nanhaiensis]UAW99785.1 transposase [Halopseudomonas nanhaiensis]